MRTISAGLAVLALTACGSVYDQPAPASSDQAATERTKQELPKDQGRLLEIWQERHDGLDQVSLGQALRVQQQELISEYKAHADSAETICVLIRSGSPRVDRRPIDVLADPLSPGSEPLAAVPPCEAMNYYQGILGKIRNIEIRLD